METVNVWSLAKQPFHQRLRYVVMEVESSYYLIDTDHYTFWLGYLCPIFNWIILHKVRKINLSSQKVNDLLLNKEFQSKIRLENEGRRSGATWIGVSLAIIFKPVLDFISSLLNFDLPIYFNYIFVLVVVLTMLLIKIYTVKNSKEILATIGEDNLYETRIRLSPESVTQGFKLLILFFMCILFCLFFFAMFIDTNNWFVLLGGALFVSFYLFINGLMMGASKYKVKLLD